MKNLTYLLVLFFLSSISAFAQIPTTGLVGYYQFNGNADDQSSLKLNGTVYGAELATDRFGKDSSAYYFDGKDTIDLGTSNRGIKDQISISAWIKLAKKGGLPAILAKYDYDNDHGYVLRTKSDDKAYMEGRDGNNIFKTSGSADMCIADGRWHHVVGIVDKNTWTVWYDGEKAKSTVTSGSSVDLSSSASMFVGGLSIPLPTGEARRFTGHIDDIAIYKRPLTDSEIESMYMESRWGRDSCKNVITVYDTIPVYDTVTVFDTIPVYDSIAVTDTLYIDVIYTSTPQGIASMKVFPNPVRSKVLISIDSHLSLNGYSIKIVDSKGVEVHTEPINASNISIDVKDIGSRGLYFLQVWDAGGNLSEVRKLVLR